MSLCKPKSYVGVDVYLASKRDNPVRHEYVQGQVYEMAGASDRHNRIALNIASRFNDYLANDQCEAFLADMKIKVAEDLFYYPDVVVTCDPPGDEPYFRTESRLILEVMTPSTARTDRHEKLMAYRRLPGFQEYVLVAQDEIMVEIYRRGDEGQWGNEVFNQPEEIVYFASIGLSLSVGDIYRNVRWETECQ